MHKYSENNYHIPYYINYKYDITSLNNVSDIFIFHIVYKFNISDSYIYYFLFLMSHFSF